MSVIDFASPSYRAASSDLTIAVSPLGLIELADEEFEVHGPRLNRYAQAWARSSFIWANIGGMLGS